MSDTDRGVYRKYDVRRLNDVNHKHDECDFFVLDLVHDRHAKAALICYAMACRDEYPVLADELLRLVFPNED